jgi:cytidylate kinase
MASSAMVENEDRFTVTISRQLGSLGHDVAQALAIRLGYRLVGRELINQAALRAGAPEAGLAMIDDLGLLGLRPSPQACLAYRHAVRQVLEELAEQGRVIIVGRAGQVILRLAPRTLHVRIIAPLQLRASRVASRERISVDSALARIEASDRARRNYLKRCYHINWNDPELYDLVINTEHVAVDTAACLVCQALPRRAQDSVEIHAQTDGAAR